MGPRQVSGSEETSWARSLKAGGGTEQRQQCAEHAISQPCGEWGGWSCGLCRKADTGNGFTQPMRMPTWDYFLLSLIEKVPDQILSGKLAIESQSDTLNNCCKL